VHHTNIGRVELATGAHYFLTKLVTFPLELQSKLLRVPGQDSRTGQHTTVRVDFRLVAQRIEICSYG